MRFFRYRRPSLKTMLGITKAKKRLNKELGITDVLKPFRWWTNRKRKIKRDNEFKDDELLCSRCRIEFHSGDGDFYFVRIQAMAGRDRDDLGGTPTGKASRMAIPTSF